ncbi:DUF998 domain-containing protein [Aquimarina sp. W85]|uniref:DUF998 domain-containing protein n=1 Tax=Aquimarina rhodophyticola TaxID=3342246 RepID=UPI00366AFEDE
MKNTLIKQAIYLPMYYFGTVIIGSLFAENYSQIGQQVSELALNENKTAGIVLTIGIFITGVSLVLFGIGLYVKFKRQFLISSFLITLFGISFLCGAVISIGSPWHSLYGLPMSILLLPFAFLYEMEKKKASKLTMKIAIIVTTIIFLYFWDLLAVKFVSFDYRGLTQRLFGIALFSWFSYSAYVLSKQEIRNKY